MKTTKGFTLIEISIVLVIIGLLAGGILKGQQMIENAKYKAWVKEIDAYRTAIYTFRDRYKYFPGDFPRASSSLPVIGGIPAVNGDGNGIIKNAEGTGNSESVHAYTHLLLAGLLPGDPNNIPKAGPGNAWLAIPTPVGGIMSAMGTTDPALDSWITDTAKRNRLMFHQIPAQLAQRYDQEFDDGIGNTGAVICYSYFNACPNGGKDYPANSSLASIFINF